MGSQEVTLSWEGHHRTIIKVFEKLLERSSLVDCTIVAEGRHRKAHKEVLLAFSPYFEMLMEEEHENNETLILSGFTFQELNALIDYMYYGKVVVTEDKVEKLIDAAQCLQIRGLGGHQDTNSEGNVTHSNACPRPVESSRDHKRRRINDIKMLSVEAGAGSKSRKQKVSQRLKPKKYPSLQLTKKKTGISSTRSFASGVSSGNTSSDLSVPGNEYNVIPRPEYVEVDECSTITCESNEGNGSILGLSADIGMGSDHNLYESVPLRQDSSYLPTIPPAVSLSSVDTPQGSVNVITLSSNEQNRNMNNPSGDLLAPTTSTGDEPCSELKLKVEPADEFLSEEIKEEATEGEAFGREMEPEDQESNHSADFPVIEESSNQYQLESGSQESSKSSDDANESTAVASAAMDQLDLSNISNQANTYVCEVCKKVFMNPLNFNLHVRTHMGDGPSKFSVYDFASVQSGNLVVHRSAPTVEKPFQCTECDYAGARSWDLTMHRRIHTGEKPFKCTECDYAASYASRLKVHQRIHTGQKPYKCSECGYAAAQSSQLKAHKRMHTGEKPYKCSECDYAAITSSHLTSHRRRQH